MPRSKDHVDMFTHIQNWVFQVVSLLILALLTSLASPSSAQGIEILPGSSPLSWDEDLAAAMVSGIDRFLTRELNLSTSRRTQNWKRTLTTDTSVADYLSEKRVRLKQIIGAVDERLPNPKIELISSSVYSSLVAETSRHSTGSTTNMVHRPSPTKQSQRRNLLPLNTSPFATGCNFQNFHYRKNSDD